MLRLLLRAIRHEAKDHGLRIILLAAVFGLLALALSTGTREHTLPPTAVVVGMVAPFASLGIGGSVVDDGASGFMRLVATQPLPRGAYAMLRIVGTGVLLFVAALPLVLGVAFSEGASWVTAIVVLALVALWSASASVLLGSLTRGPATAAGVWIFLCVVNLLGILATWRGMAMDDWLVRARHALPGPSAIEALTPLTDPWLWTALTTLLLEVALMTGGALLFEARGWRQAERAPSVGRAAAGATFVLAVALPFFLPTAPGVSR